MFGALNPEFLTIFRKMADASNVACFIQSYQTQGNRLTQDDRIMLLSHHFGYINLVCDGHGAWHPADLVVENIVSLINKEFKSAISTYGSIDEIDEIREESIFKTVVGKLHELTMDSEGGTTFTLAFYRHIKRDENNNRRLRLTLVSLGDSPVCVFDNNQYVHMPLHSARYNLHERQRIEDEGHGYIENGYLYSNELHPRSGGVAMTRALGDKTFNSVLSRIPPIKVFDITPRAVIVLASDGAINNDQPDEVEKTMVNFINETKLGKSAQEIVLQLGERNDNTSLLSIQFKEPQVEK